MLGSNINIILALEILHLKCLSLLLSLHHKHLSLTSHRFKLFKNVFACWPSVSVVGASSCLPKGCKFDSQSRHIPGLWVWSWLGRQLIFLAHIIKTLAFKLSLEQFKWDSHLQDRIKARNAKNTEL